MKNDKYKRLIAGQVLDNDFWPSFTDLLSTILLVLLLFLMAIIVNAKEDAEKREKVIQQAAKTIQKQERELEYYRGIRKEIIAGLKQEFQKKNLKIDVDSKTGAIKFQNDLLFDTNSDQIKPEFRRQLKMFIPIYFNILYKDYGDHIAEIVVEGHTDDIGSYMYNLELSQKRAFSVVKYILSDEFGSFPYKEKVRMQITANGRSFSNLKYTKGKTVDRESSRRVEFKFRLKSDVNFK
ncbi:outer membrane protein OmpA-like peptidoglycan-associated protein [Anoxybacillus voinovskiensis]|uniref:Outer membrane protein OmpA-like peptidoglycan-associated protein n=1 Tax=Anoxybacteroides voinovskiense TaxID=230470 RepID=A0A840E1A8_9BACL|nr:OmpA family protein [Anoxybacillus voinovskiensis]MBB4075549.1 outer membrane protein OmpA-like peptidoglycan-associated protein [Anoxybacillus voinovskiensis]GGJ80686.1 membrane protein [Anoxybacillus voinovskiensis]